MKLLITILFLASMQSTFANTIFGTWENKQFNVVEDFRGFTILVDGEYKNILIQRFSTGPSTAETRVYTDDNKTDIRVESGVFNSVQGILPCGLVNITINRTFINGEVCGISFHQINYQYEVDAKASVREVVLNELVKELPLPIRGAMKLKIGRKINF